MLSYPQDANMPLATGKREIMQLAGDAPDPTGLTDYRGAQSTLRLNGGKREVVVVYHDVLMTVDVYALPGEPMHISLLCPRCHKPLRIPGDRKSIDFEPNALNPARIAAAGLPPEVAAVAATGKLSVEPFECTWELGDDKHVAGGLHTGTNLCRLRIAIDNNRAKDA